MTRRPILVTGAHRTGTTWVGTALARAPRMYYVHEPFSPNRGDDSGHGGGQRIFDRWYAYVAEPNEQAHRAGIEREILDGHEARKARGERSIGESEIENGESENGESEIGESESETDESEIGEGKLPKGGPLNAAKKALRPLRRRFDPILPVVKDPIALLSAPWLARHFDMNVVVMIRHPAGFAASLIRKDWRFPFEDLASQPLLMDGPLKAFAAEIRDFAQSRRDVVGQAGLLWKVLYSVVARYRREHTDWHFVIYEDLARDRARGFRDLYRKLDLRGIDRALEEGQQLSAFARDPKSWRNELDEGAVNQLREATEPVWREFYRDEDWD